MLLNQLLNIPFNLLVDLLFIKFLHLITLFTTIFLRFRLSQGKQQSSQPVTGQDDSPLGDGPADLQVIESESLVFLGVLVDEVLGQLEGLGGPGLGVQVIDLVLLDLVYMHTIQSLSIIAQFVPIT